MDNSRKVIGFTLGGNNLKLSCFPKSTKIVYLTSIVVHGVYSWRIDYNVNIDLVSIENRSYEGMILANVYKL